MPPTGAPPTPPLPPGGTPPGGLSAPSVGGTPPTPPSGLLDGAGKALGKAADAAREQLGDLTSREPSPDQQDEAAADEPGTNEAAAPAPQDPAAALDPDYTNTWNDAPRSRRVVTEIVHQPPRRPPPPPAYEPYEPRVHGFAGLSLRGTTTTNHNPSMLSGARFGFVFDDRFTIGGAFYSLTARIGGPIVDPVGNKLGMRMAYGGLLLGWTLYKGRVMSLGLETMAGAGAACVSKNRRSHGRWECIEKVGLVSIEPGLSLGFTVTDWVRLGITGGYRFVTREAWRAPNEFTLSGPFVGLDIDFGAFRTDD